MESFRRRSMRPSWALLGIACWIGAAGCTGKAKAAPAATEAAGSASARGDEAPFLAENDAAMNKMMADMAVAPTGDVDRDFVAMMVPHHQGAIDMARAVLRYGHNEQVRRIAQEIVVEQMQEIAAMTLAVGQPLPPSIPAPTRAGVPEVTK
ncbi:DUF305 domain-containing protein [Pendulispora albinea]|uniref:DUF305 domain-containing protein n=1 Tax=Pendulispora albinea TaxID=2741071 RepID=A0ABZ2LP11_9BACT